MGFFSSIFGGTDDSAQELTAADNARRQAFIEEQAAQARGDVFNLFPGAQQVRQEGFQGALDVFGQTIPQQLGLLQAGLPQQINAILGKPLDLSGLQSTNTDFAQQTAPSLPPLPPQQQTPQGDYIAQLLASLGGLK
jgi:hypothetical protein